MKFYKHLYIGDTIKNPAKLKSKLKMHSGVNIFVIAIACGADQLEIYHSAYLKQKYYRYHPPIIVGLASDYKEALQIVLKITEECVLHTGNCNLKDYLKQKAKMSE